MTESEVRRDVRIYIERAGSLRALAKQWGVCPALLSDLMNGRRRPGPKILKPMGLRVVKTITYERTHQAWEAIS
jgi:hypothetical protein